LSYPVITIGINAIIKNLKKLANKAIIMASGESKSEIIRKCLEDEVNDL
jgi:6-phosphogluconolactonase/glucosamine-6-phosphate isomerase/deaminase